MLLGRNRKNIIISSVKVLFKFREKRKSILERKDKEKTKKS